MKLLTHLLLPTFAAAAALAASTMPAVPSATQPTTQSATRPATQRVVTQPMAANLRVQETAVFVLDASTGQLNPDGIVTATLPGFVIDHRYGAASDPPPTPPQANNNIMVINGMVVRNGGASKPRNTDTDSGVNMDAPSPVGVIRLFGTADSKVDVSITAKGGTFAGSWPKAEDRSGEVLWRDLSIAGSTDQTLSPVTPDNWISKLRGVDAAYLSIEHSPTERFLLYDLQMPYPSPLKIGSAKNGSITITNSGAYPLRDLVLCRDAAMAMVGDLPVAPKAAPAAPHPAKAATVPTTAAVVHAASRPATRAAMPAVAASKPADASVVTVSLNKPATSQPTSQPVLSSAAWARRMAADGVDKADCAMIDKLLLRYATDKRLTAVYAMDDAEIDHLLPIEVVPQPAKIQRFVLVIVINADPSAGNVVDDLIRQLGEDDWSRRDAAYHALAAMGPAATKKLQTAAKDKDLEVAWRAERLLALNPQVAK